MRTPAKNEQLVREHWVVGRTPTNDDLRPGQTPCGLFSDPFTLTPYVDIGPHRVSAEGSNRSEADTWSAAAEFTERRMEEIRQVEEEVALIDDLIGYKLSDIQRETDEMPSPHIESDPAALLIYVRDLCEYSRILAREQAALESLKKGMRL